MTSENSDHDGEVNQQIPETPSFKKGRPIIWLIFNLFALMVIAVFVYFNFNTTQELKNDNTSTELADSIRSDLEKISGDMSAVNLMVRQFESDISSLTSAVDQSNESLEILYSNQNNQDRRVSITEVVHLINIANVKLKLEENINVAIIALEEANNRLADIGDPGLFSVRRQLTADINTLKSTPQVDFAGMSFTLSDLARRVDNLPLKSTSIAGEIQNSIPIDQSLPAWRKLLLGVWYEFKSMFIITRTSDGISTSLLPNEKFFLFQNLRLQLETARLAVLQREAVLFRDSLELAESWLKEYFDTNATPVMNAIELLIDLKSMELNLMIPDIDGSLQAIQIFLDETPAVDSTEASAIEQQ